VVVVSFASPGGGGAGGRVDGVDYARLWLGGRAAKAKLRVSACQFMHQSNSLATSINIFKEKSRLYFASKKKQVKSAMCTK